MTNPHRRWGVAMLAAAWLLILAGGWWVMDRWLAHQENPNRRVVSTGSGEVVLARNRMGHYVASGEINRRPVTFLVDTGATTVALSTALGRELGLAPGAPVTLRTANGVAQGFQTRIDSIRLGDLELRDVSATLTDGLTDRTVLLGMSFLKHLELVQRDGVLILRPQR